jgi:mono/diheme cytochrome c family protein
MQHSARDPLRDHKHGRIYRITYPDRPLVKPAKIDSAPLVALFHNLTLPEDRTRYRTRRELRARDPQKIIPALKEWIATLKLNMPRYDHILLEALWVTWGFDQLDEALLTRLLKSKNPKVRAAAVDALRYNGHRIANQSEILAQAASDQSSRVRLHTTIAASWLTPKQGLSILKEVAKSPSDKWLAPVLETATAHLKGQKIKSDTAEKIPQPTSPLQGEALTFFKKGHEVYSREGHCITCHQSDGKGLPAAMFPPLAGTKWINGSEERLIKLTLHGLLGPIEVKGKKYPGQVPMTAFQQLNNEEIAAVLTYVRNTFSNNAPMVTPAKVAEVRKATNAQNGFLAPADLLKEHPH